ncbi:Uncharacterised protein [uncultured archaeon]|nr:Uncharacterised protein [uncultured archaeon]
MDIVQVTNSPALADVGLKLLTISRSGSTMRIKFDSADPVITFPTSSLPWRFTFTGERTAPCRLPAVFAAIVSNSIYMA